MAERETEVKVEVADSAVLDGLPDLPGVRRVRSVPAVRLEATYFDSPGLRLARAGMTLRRRTGGDDAGWHLKLPGEKSSERFEVHAEDEGSATEVPSRLRDVLAAQRGSDELAPVARIRTDRTVYQLLGDDGTLLAEVADDRVSGQPLPDGDEVRWREVEVELADGDRSLLDAARRRLLDLEGAGDAGPAKLFRTLGGRPPASVLAPPDDVGEPTAVLVQARLGQQVDQVRRWDPLVRERLPGGVHQIRTSIRRLRDGLATARPFLDEEEVAAVRDELKWLANEMGAARDAEVQEARLRRNLEEVGLTNDGSVQMLARISDAALLDAMQTLGTDRYLALLARLDDLVAAPPWSHDAADPIGKAYLPRVKRNWKRLATRVAAADETEDPTARADALHEARKAAKRLRYAVEPLVPLVGKPADRTRKDARRLQKLLGNHHDAVVSRRTAQRLAANASPSSAFALGAVLEREGARLAEVEAEFERAWTKARRKKRRRWFW